jgi:CRP/FNR family transcriptional regulator
MLCGNNSCPFFDVENQCIVTDAVQQVSFDKGAVLFLKGQSSSSLFALTAGMVKICTNTSDGWEQIVGLSGPSNLLVGLQSIRDERHAYTGIAVTSVRACEISDRAVLDGVQDNGDVAMRLVAALNAQLAHSRALVEVLGHKFAAAKIASFILLMTPKSGHGVCFFGLPFSRLDTASLLGIREETVCRLMAGMQRAGAIHAPRGKIEIRDWNKLQAIADGHTGGELAA